MMNRGNMGKEVSTASKSKPVKKMMMGGRARPAMLTSNPSMEQKKTFAQKMLGGGRPSTPGGIGANRDMATPMPTKPAMLGRLMGMANRGKVDKKAAGGAVKGYAKGGMASRGDGCCMNGKTKGALK